MTNVVKSYAKRGPAGSGGATPAAGSANGSVPPWKR